VNTFLNAKGSPTLIPGEVIRATSEAKEAQIQTLNQLDEREGARAEKALLALRETALKNGNLFTDLMEATKYCSLGQITHTLFEVGGQYRRNM
jgi:methylmalonyl-CoA mutase